MTRYCYSATVSEFLLANPDQILGVLSRTHELGLGASLGMALRCVSVVNAENEMRLCTNIDKFQRLWQPKRGSLLKSTIALGLVALSDKG